MKRRSGRRRSVNVGDPLQDLNVGPCEKRAWKNDEDLSEEEAIDAIQSILRSALGRPIEHRTYTDVDKRRLQQKREEKIAIYINYLHLH